MSNYQSSRFMSKCMKGKHSCHRFTALFALIDPLCTKYPNEVDESFIDFTLFILPISLSLLTLRIK